MKHIDRLLTKMTHLFSIADYIKETKRNGSPPATHSTDGRSTYNT